MMIFYLNLDKDVDRRESMERQLQLVGLPYERISGVYGAGLSDHELSEVYSKHRAMRRYCMDLNKAQIGCAMSKILAYREILERDLPYALILEDDVILPGNLKVSIEFLEKVVDKHKAEIILLSPAAGNFTKTNKVRCANSIILGQYTGGFYASSYIVTKYAAESLLKELFPIDDVADCWPRIKRYKIADIFVLKQPLIEQDQDTFGSSTTADYKGFSNLGAKLIYKARRLRCVIMDFFQAAWRRQFHPYNNVLKTRQ
ncbi:MAG: glycosyltransferase family 25 protein [Desulfobulbaceae bacterium]